MRARIGVRAAGGQQAVRELHHLRVGAVVAGQLDRVRPAVASRELQQVAAGRAGEGVNRLGGVAHHADVVAAAQPHVQQALLQRGDVLILVYHKVAVLVADGRGKLLVLLEHGDGQQ